ncbi:DEAD/DEAH box helicase [Adhaeribacter swui]|uniref:DEAD-box ATP-dependent RNA helicase RhpA n=1 Tax=Adhaeribacter swui TaxID=2086471 RepID=A0A7G7G963_9BACT|nr:DEAD/DEAH box helicase [Adhaeribacter swui]QNF33697.1 DEAD/DEAH box helicase [Adhaeribacter swui]
MLFSDLQIIEPILKALQTEGYTHPTPIQERSIPVVLNQQDLLGCAQTGTGKTAAFAIPIIQLLHNQQKPTKSYRPIKALILTPTRELAIQIGESFEAYGRHTNLRHRVIFGGVPQKAQTDALRAGVDILIATPGRLLDLMNQGFISLQHLTLFVLDEADRMLDMGFVHDVKKVITKLPAKRQSLFFSATMPPEITKLADTILVNPVKVEVTPVSSTAQTIEQAVYYVEKNDKKPLLLHLLADSSIETALIFTRTKHGADRVAKDLNRAGIGAEAIHGNKSQNARQRALTNFKNRQTRVLVATDIAARGIDVEELTHVINFELPNVPETYVHRIGRTGRAGANGIAWSFCDAEEQPYLRDINKLIAKTIPVVHDHPYPMVPAANPTLAPPTQTRTGNSRNNNNFKKSNRRWGAPAKAKN